MKRKITHVISKIKDRAISSNDVKPNASDPFNPLFLKTLNYETPYFLFSRKRVIDSYKEFQKYFPSSHIQYAMKANSESEILKTLSEAGSGFEVASKHELDILKKLKVPAEKIIYGTSVKPASHIKDFAEYGVDKFSFDSETELEKIAAVAKGANVYVRTVANDAGSVFKFSEKFGTDQGSIIPLLLQAKKLGLKPYGISFHVGSQASDPQAWANVLITLRSVIQELQDQGIKLEAINLGGGFPCKYLSSENVPSLKEIAAATMKQYKKLPYNMQIILEPGRGIVATTGIAVATIIAKVERRASTWLFLDLGVYNGLFETMAFQGSTRYPITNMRPIGDAGEKLFSIAGPTGDSPDVITREALLPQDIDVGDKVIIHDVGAYSICMTSPFNGFPKPKAYYI